MSDRSPYEGCGEDAAPYVLGALSDPEHAAFLAHLEGCAECREEVAALQSVVDTLPAAVPQMGAPSPLRDRVMVTVHSEAGLRAEPSSQVRRRRVGRPAGLSWRWIAGSATATAATVLAAVFIFGGGSGTTSKLYSAKVTSAAAKVTLRVSSGRGTLQIAHMPQTAPGKVYEVWVKRAGAPQPTNALFTVSSSGAATVGVPGDLHGVTAVLVTAEPEGGSRVPTSAPVIVANLT